MDKLSWHELLHTASIMSDMFDRSIVQHKVLQVEPELAAKADTIGELLGEFYQMVGSKSCAAADAEDKP